MGDRTIHATPQEVEALLAGRLATFWRPVKPPPESGVGMFGETWTWREEMRGIPDMVMVMMEQMCPYGQPGDLLAVKEAWGYWPGTILADRDILYRATVADAPREWPIRRGPIAEFVRWRSPATMPRWAVRDGFIRPIVGVRVVRVQATTEEEARAAGFDQDICAKVFHQAAGKQQWEFPRWLEGDDGGSLYCPECAEIEAAKEKCEVDGWDDSPEEDGPRWCGRCGVLLCHSLTKHGIEQELSSLAPVTGGDASILANLAGGIGDLRKEHLGRLAQIGFATAWDTRYANTPYAWAENPPAWAVTIGG